MEEDGFQLVNGKNKRKTKRDFKWIRGENDSAAASEETTTAAAVTTSGGRVGLKEKERSKVPFHIATIPRPQDQYRILVNNQNRPFEHVWLQRSEDGTQIIHPLEKLSVEDFVDRTIKEIDIVKPLPLENTPFKLVEGVKELKELVAKLRNANEFAVDLEHNQYRSFQGMTCLMQISTRTEDFIIDTLKLRIHVGPYLREVFKDPSKRKVMHGADRDIEWLQRDFGIYICNLFDTGQASKVMQLERNSLEYLLQHFCGVSAAKEYQNADWRLRPLPAEMLKYAREDTHYLLYIYDLMRQRLLSASADENDLLLEVYKRSYTVCTQLYQKELLTDSSFLHIYGLQEAEFNAKQLAVVAGLYQWRDKIARDEDESTGYILPNKALLEIARHMPVSHGKLLRMVKSKQPFVERHVNDVLKIIRSSIEKASAFEIIAEELKLAQSTPTKQNGEATGDKSERILATEGPMISRADECQFGNFDTSGTTGKEKIEFRKTEHISPTDSVSISPKPSYSFGALLENSGYPKSPYDTPTVEDISKSDLASSFGDCFRSISQMSGTIRNHKQSQEPNQNHLDYAIIENMSELKNANKNSVTAPVGPEERITGLQPQAYPSSGKSSTTYK